MKKIVLTIAGLLSVLLAFADKVDRRQAQTIAQKWLGAEVTETSYGSDAFYIFNGADGGWVIISAEDAATPVLGYSDTGSLNPNAMPENFHHWIGGYEKVIAGARSEKVRATAEVRALWKNAGARTKATSQKVIDTPIWGQEGITDDSTTPYYNYFCPEVVEGSNTRTSVTGCVATAMAEVIRYHQWPEHGTGTIGGYTYKSDYNKNVEIPSYNIDSHIYNYNLMPFEPQEAGTSYQYERDAIAQLMHDCGVMVEAMYNNQTGTGAYSENIANALINHMSYSPKANLIYRQAYSDAEWTRIIEKEIDADRPIIYAGNDSKNGGHQFVCDGYDTRDYIHINWGWLGDGNGFFTLSLKIPGEIEGSYIYSFSEFQSMVIGLEPNKSGETAQIAGPLIYDLSDTKSPGLTLKSGSVLGKSFSLKAEGVFNCNYYITYDGALKAALVDWKGDVKEYISNEVDLQLEGYNITSLDNLQCTISGDVTFGDRVALYYKTHDGNWEMVKGKEAYDNSDKAYYVKESIPAVDGAFILIPEGLKAGDTFFFELVPGSLPVKAITWYYDGAKQAGITANLTAGTHAIAADVTFSDGSKEKITAKIIVK